MRSPSNEERGRHAGPGPTVRVVALRYEPEASSRGGASRAAPEVVAKGRGEIARRILEIARRHDVPVRQDADLLPLLAACELGEEIPTELYAAVAELLAFLFRLSGASVDASTSPSQPGAATRLG